MNHSLRLQQSLKQQLTLSPQLIQTFEILAMSTLELQQKIKAEIEQNPALEIPSERSVSIERMSEIERSAKRDDDLSDNSDYYSYGTRLSSYYDQQAADNNQQFIEGALARSETLQQHLMRQLGCLALSEEQQELGRLIISNLDFDGFHKNSVESLVKPNKLAQLLEVLTIVQSLDPIGIGAADFRQSLILQAKADNLSDEDLELFTLLVNDHLELLRLNKFKEVAKITQADEEHIETLYHYLKTLNPHPGLQYDSRQTHYIIPDLYVKKIGGKLQLRLNSDNIPTLTIDPEFVAIKKQQSEHDKRKVTSYINKAVRDATQLIEQINMRSDTMKRLGLTLLKFQHEFFLSGPQYLKPLTYREIAQELDLHETTISRAVQGKYIDTDWGIIPIKELFSSALPTTGNQEKEISKRAVMEMVKEIIETHEGEKALSDQKIADILGNRGIKIARRTVAKYRHQLQIDSSYERVP